MKIEEIKVGTPVIYWGIITEKGERLNPIKTTITSEPWALGHGQIVCKVAGISGGVAISHLDTITAGSLMAAKIQGLTEISTEEINEATETFFKEKGVEVIDKETETIPDESENYELYSKRISNYKLNDGELFCFSCDQVIQSINLRRHDKSEKHQKSVKDLIERMQSSAAQERTKNEMGDFVIDGKLTIKELYELAKQEGFEDRHLFFSIKNKTTGQYFSTDIVADFGKGWAKDSAIMHLTWKEEIQQDACGGN